MGVLTCREVEKRNITRAYRTRIIFFIPADAELMFQLVGLRSPRNGYRIIDSFTEANDFAHRFSRCSGFLKRWCLDPLCDGIGILGKLVGSSPRLLDEILAIRMERGNVRHLPCTDNSHLCTVWHFQMSRKCRDR